MKRSIARWGLLVALLAIVALSSGLVQAMGAATTDAVAESVRSGIEEAPPTAAALRVQSGGGQSVQAPR